MLYKVCALICFGHARSVAVFGDKGKVAEIFAAVEAVADGEVVGDDEERHVRLEVDSATGGLIKECDHAQRFRTSAL